jgi:hypothetical protein
MREQRGGGQKIGTNGLCPQDQSSSFDLMDIGCVAADPSCDKSCDTRFRGTSAKGRLHSGSRCSADTQHSGPWRIRRAADARGVGCGMGVHLRPTDCETAVYARGRAWVLLQRLLQYLDHRMGGRASCSLRTVPDAEARDPLNPIQAQGVGNHGNMSAFHGLPSVGTTSCRTPCRTLPEQTATITATVRDRSHVGWCSPHCR